MSTSAISTPPVRSSQKRPGDVISQSPTKRTQLTLPQIPPDMEQAPLMGDKAVLLALTRHYNWVIDEVATPLSDQQFADLFDVIMRCEWEIHSDWKPIANNKEERLTMFLRAVRVAGSALKDALDEAWIDGAFVRIRNAGICCLLFLVDLLLHYTYQPFSDRHCQKIRA
ncbi:hypothetical protein QCA50_006128 [Cerrena zonata]|uniref:Uncharacterized protein n=1 Tax=Cerrena zonata TaxID=2478898 RepID=A0AAW0GII5_9APHY